MTVIEKKEREEYIKHEKEEQQKREELLKEFDRIKEQQQQK